MAVRDVWPHEAYDFTTWLEENIEVLNDYIASGLDPESVRREQSAGAFSVDLVAENDDGETVIVENQLGRSDHDHLGKVLTYAAAFEADVAIWIVGDPRPEHVKAVAWLNDSSALSVYIFKIEAIKIGNSPAAPLLTLILGPSEDAKQIASSKQEKTLRHVARRSFFEQLLEHAGTRTRLHSGRSATDSTHLDGASGHAGMNLTYHVTKEATKVMLWIDKGQNSDRWNEAVYHHLLDHRTQIETTFGRPLTWSEKANNRSRTLESPLDLGGWVDTDTWPTVIEATVGEMIKFEAALRPHLPDAVRAADAAVYDAE